MIVLGDRKLVEVLAEWGLHEAEGRLRGKLPEAFIPPADGPDRSAAGVEIALRHRSPLAGRILSAGPVAVLRVEFEADDRAGLCIADGRRLSGWAVAISTPDSEEGRYVLNLAGSDPITRHLVCAVHAPDGDLSNLQAPIVVYDGWHRGAAWMLQMEAGQHHTISGDLILTQRLDAALSIQPIEDE